VAEQIITIVRRSPKPTPRPASEPTPQPTPVQTPAPHYTLAPLVVVLAPAAQAAATPTRQLGGAAAHLRLIHATPRPAPALRAEPPSLAEGTRSGQQNGGTGTGAGPGNGTGGSNGTSSGTGSAGNGNGGDTSAAPCGAVTLIPDHGTYHPDGSVEHVVVARIELRDGTIKSGQFPYPFVYPAPSQDPFLSRSDLAENGMAIQEPPPGTDLSDAPPAIITVLKYTDPRTGLTNLSDCPKAAP